MNSKKLLSLVLTGMLAVTALVGCGKKESTDTGNSTPSTSSEKANTDTGEKSALEDPNKKVELRFSWWGGDSRHEATRKAVDAFMKKYPNITVKTEFGGWDGWQDKYTAQMAGKSAPDVSQTNWNWLTIFSKDGNGFYDLNQLSKELGLENYDQDILKLTSVQGKLNGIPVSMAGRVFYYNKTTWDKFKVAIPKTWDELLAAGGKFEKGSWPIDISSYDAWLLAMTYVEQKTGKQFIDNDGKLQYTVDDIKIGLQFYKDLMDKKVCETLEERVSEGGASDAAVVTMKRWIEGNYAGAFEWTSSASKIGGPLKEKNMEMILGNLPIPSDAKSSGAILKPSMMFSINKETKYPKESAALLNFLLNDPEGVKLMSMERGIPLSKSAYDTLKADGKLKGLEFDGTEWLKANKGVGISPYVEHSKLKAIYISTAENLSYGQKSVDEAAQYMYDEVEKALKSITK